MYGSKYIRMDRHILTFTIALAHTHSLIPHSVNEVWLFEIICWESVHASELFFSTIRVYSIEYILLRHVKRCVYTHTVAFICMTKTSSSRATHAHTLSSKEFYGDSTHYIWTGYSHTITSINFWNMCVCICVCVHHCRSVLCILHWSFRMYECECARVCIHSEIFGGVFLLDLKMYEFISHVISFFLSGGCVQWHNSYLVVRVFWT